MSHESLARRRTTSFTTLESDPFDDGDISGGITAHTRAGNSLQQIVAFAVRERNYLRVQNAKLWTVIERQKTLIESLKSDVGAGGGVVDVSDNDAGGGVVPDTGDELANYIRPSASVSAMPHPSRSSSILAPAEFDKLRRGGGDTPPRSSSPSADTHQNTHSPYSSLSRRTIRHIPVTLASATHSDVIETTAQHTPNVANISLNPGDEYHVRIAGSSFQGSGTDGTLFFFMVRKDKTGDEWKIEKRYSDFLHLDTKLKSKLTRPVVTAIGKLPDKQLFTSVNPLKSDQRKIGLEMYLQRIMHAAPDSGDLLDFLTNSVSFASGSVTNLASGGNGGGSEAGDIDGLLGSSIDVSVLKEGYLMKRGSTFGGWKPKYFKCKPYFLDFADAPQRDILSTISLKHCHVSPIRNTPNDAKSAHGFVLTEFYREFYPVPLDVTPEDKKISHRHVLAADDDAERDEWVAVLSKQIIDARNLQGIPEKSMSSLLPMSSGPVDIHRVLTASSPRTSKSHSTLVGNPTPIAVSGGSLSNGGGSGTSGLGMNSGSHPGLGAHHFATTTVAAGAVKNSVDDNARAMQQNPRPLPKLFASVAAPLGKENSQISVGGNSLMMGGSNSAVKGLMNMRNAFAKKKIGNENTPRASDPSRVIFGATLDHAIAVSRISDDLELPAIIYRCLEYLDHVKASQEEGIYRLSGSANAIQQLKMLFNSEGDVDLINLTTETFDAHTVSGLLKLYLRELPSPVLTAHLQKEFLGITDFDDRNDRVLELSRLVSLLPKSNYTLLEVLISHLVSIVQASETNKMTVRNVGIVFAPTLGVPALVFILLLAEFDEVFCWHDVEAGREMMDKISAMNRRKAEKRDSDQQQQERERQKHDGELEESRERQKREVAPPEPQLQLKDSSPETQQGELHLDQMIDMTDQAGTRLFSPIPMLPPVSPITVIGTTELMSDNEILRLMDLK
ncbi:hypothetical protein HDU81_004441 [Chytriomyces hyalinus]|nr:hypothetical protein HDU81_004441 [Chytriomyces hyalinus]